MAVHEHTYPSGSGYSHDLPFQDPIFSSSCLILLLAYLQFPLPDTNHLLKLVQNHYSHFSKPIHISFPIFQSKITAMAKTPVYFISHGGPNLIYDVDHPAYKNLQEIGTEITTQVKPKAVVVFSAHWQATGKGVEVNTADSGDLTYESVSPLLGSKPTPSTTHHTVRRALRISNKSSKLLQLPIPLLQRNLPQHRQQTPIHSNPLPPPLRQHPRHPRLPPPPPRHLVPLQSPLRPDHQPPKRPDRPNLPPRLRGPQCPLRSRPRPRIPTIAGDPGARVRDGGAQSEGPAQDDAGSDAFAVWAVVR